MHPIAVTITGGDHTSGQHGDTRHDDQKTPIASNGTQHAPLSLLAGINPVQFGHGLPAHVRTPVTAISLAEDQSCIRPCRLYDSETLDLAMVAVLLSDRVGAGYITSSRHASLSYLPQAGADRSQPEPDLCDTPVQQQACWLQTLCRVQAHQDAEWSLLS